VFVRSAVSRIDPYLEIGTIGSRCICSFYACSVHALGSCMGSGVKVHWMQIQMVMGSCRTNREESIGRFLIGRGDALILTPVRGSF
jgi:hypothetical protein